MTATIAALKTPAATAAGIAAAEDAGAGAVDAGAVDARKAAAAAIFLLQNMHRRKGTSGHMIPAAATTRAASKVAVSNRVNLAAQKARASTRRPLR
jgi:hypothetical protein